MSASPAWPVDDPVGSRIMGGLDFTAYAEKMREYAERIVTDTMTEKERDHLANAGINQQRFTRIARTYSPSAGIRHAMGRIRKRQVWMLLSELWCGDSAQSVPYIAGIAALSPHVVLRMMLRDENPDIMDAYLTGGKRCIPKLVVFSAEGEELWRWGARPKAAQAVVDSAFAEGVSRQVRLERLHLWYGRNRGVELEAELSSFVGSALEHGID
jgi:hypothetical protein